LKRAIITAVLLVPIVAMSDNTVQETRVLDALTPVDSVATITDLELVFPETDDASRVLCSLAVSPTAGDVGLQLRAIHALTNFHDVPGASPRQTLADLVDGHRTATTGTDALILTAALRALGSHPDKQHDDAARLAASLTNPCRDVRLAAARALRDAGDPTQIGALLAQQHIEMGPRGVKEVASAIDEALQKLGNL